MPELTTEQIENVQIDYGILFANHGETDARMLGPTRGGGEFKANATVRQIEFDGQKGMTKGMKVVEEINASLTVVTLDTSMSSLALAMPWATYDNILETITCTSENIGVIGSEAYLKNLTMFAKVIGGGYRKIILYNAMNEKEFSLAAKPKSEGEVSLEVNAHWDATDDTANLFKVEPILSIGGDAIIPTATTVPIDAATAVVVTANLTAAFNEDIRVSDVNSDNFILIKASDGTIVDGVLAYVPATKVVTFDPTASLTAATPYIWTITNVRDLTGNKMTPKIVNFATA